jgi:hypothetical protein
LGPKCSTWANLLLVALGFMAWLLLRDGSGLATPEGVGQFIGATLGAFGSCGAFGWLASSLAWRLCKKSQTPTMIGFVVGVAGILFLGAIGNARMERAAPAPQSGNEWDQFAAVNQTALRPAAPRALNQVMANSTSGPAEQPAAPQPGAESTVPADPFSKGSEPTASGASDIDLPPDALKKIKRVGAQDDVGDMRGTIRPPDGWVLSSVQVEIHFLDHRPGSKTLSGRIYSSPNDADGVVHFWIREARAWFDYAPANELVWRIISAKGHRIDE